MARIAKKVVHESGVSFEFANGEILNCDLGGISNQDVIDRLVLHGISQKVGDSYAGAESIAEAYAAAKGVWDNLVSGVWALKAQRGGKIVEALHRITGQPFEVCLEKWTGMSDDEQKALRKNAQIKLMLAEMEAERAKAIAENAETGSDLSELF